MSKQKHQPNPRISLRENRVTGRDLGWRALHHATASEGFVAERVDWHNHVGTEVLMFLRGAAEYEFRRGRRLSVAGDQFLMVPPRQWHRAARDMRSPTMHSSITIDLSSPAGGGNPFTKAEIEWLRSRLVSREPVVRAMTPLLRRLAHSFHQSIHQFPTGGHTPDVAAVLRLQLGRILVEAARAGDTPSAEQGADIVTAAIAHLEEHFRKPVQIDSVAKQVGCSRTRLYAAFKRETGLSPNDWLLRLRVKKAVEMLCKTDEAIMNIAHHAGFSSHAYFCQVLRKYTGRTPGEHRRNQSA